MLTGKVLDSDIFSKLCVKEKSYFAGKLDLISLLLGKKVKFTENLKFLIEN